MKKHGYDVREAAEGVLSNSAIALIKQVWTNLSSIGFSGYDSDVLDQKNLTLSFPSDHLRVGGAELGDIFNEKEYKSLPLA